ncbi:hypothetical protein ID866_5648 [Astraeus odoratus]|nr:hypothetical protein ID866_5648 [Astraeus odoratus]
MSSAEQRLQVVQNALMGVPPSLLILPDGKKVNLRCQEGLQRKDTTTLVPLDMEITLDDVPLCLLRTSGRNSRLIISGVGTPYEHTTSHIPQYLVLEVHPPKGTVTTSAKAHISLPDMWTIIYALFTKYHEQENIPIVLAAEVTNGEELRSYILRSGLGRTSPSQRVSPEELFLMRATFWQGAGQIGFHERGWLPPSPSAKYARSCFPFIQSFTRTPLVIAAHPLRPPKPEQGEVLYKRYCPTVGQTLEFTYFDLGTDGSVSAHLQAFHRWHNEERVNKFWGEAGSLQQHREYIVRAMNDPAKLPVMMSWDGELMGYLEIIWVKVCLTE